MARRPSRVTPDDAADLFLQILSHRLLHALRVRVLRSALVGRGSRAIQVGKEWQERSR
jgi:hypothetical protein